MKCTFVNFSLVIFMSALIAACGGGGGGSGGGGTGGGSGGGGGGTGGGSGGGGGDAFDPCNTDLDDPSTWPPGVDTEQEYEDWLLQNVFWIAQNCN